METAGKLAGFAVCAALVALILRRLRPEAGWGVSLSNIGVIFSGIFLSNKKDKLIIFHSCINCADALFSSNIKMDECLWENNKSSEWQNGQKY